jgi:hypothetical protein
MSRVAFTIEHYRARLLLCTSNPAGVGGGRINVSEVGKMCEQVIGGCRSCGRHNIEGERDVPRFRLVDADERGAWVGPIPKLAALETAYCRSVSAGYSRPLAADRNGDLA